MASLSAIHEKALSAFEYFFVEIAIKGGGRLTTHTAADIAANLSKSIFAPIAEQIDPLHMGEAQRSMQIARQYGERLAAVGKNITPSALDSLISNYPSHGFAIDLKEAQLLFKNVSVCDIGLSNVVASLSDFVIDPRASPIVRFLNDAKVEAEETDTHGNGSTTSEFSEIQPSALAGADVPSEVERIHAKPNDNRKRTRRAHS